MRNGHSLAYCQAQGREGRVKRLTESPWRVSHGVPSRARPSQSLAPALLKSGSSFQALRGGPLALGGDLSEETHVLTKHEPLPGRGTGRRAGGKGTQACPAMWLAGPGFMGLGLPSSLSLVTYSGPSWRCTHCSAKMESREEDSGRRRDTGSLLLTFPKFFWSAAACQCRVAEQGLPS